MNRQVKPLSREGKKKFNQMFAALRKVKLAARQNFMCCQNCGVTELVDMIEDDQQLVGYAFYHQQDTSRLHEEQGTWVAYGGVTDRGYADADVGRMIVKAAHDAGLFTTWDGNPSTRIYVSEVPPS